MRQSRKRGRVREALARSYNETACGPVQQSIDNTKHSLLLLHRLARNHCTVMPTATWFTTLRYRRIDLQRLGLWTIGTSDRARINLAYSLRTRHPQHLCSSCLSDSIETQIWSPLRREGIHNALESTCDSWQQGRPDTAWQSWVIIARPLSEDCRSKDSITDNGEAEQSHSSAPTELRERVGHGATLLWSSHAIISTSLSIGLGYYARRLHVVSPRLRYIATLQLDSTIGNKVCNAMQREV